MDNSRFDRLRQLHIAKPCPENWDAMEGDEQKRFCAGCGCHVHNISALDAEQAEELLAQPGRVCTRMMVDSDKGVLTKSGWIPRMLLAGAMAASVAGCNSGTTTGEVNSPEAVQTRELTGEASRPLPTEIRGTPAPIVTLGKTRIEPEKPTPKETKQSKK